MAAIHKLVLGQTLYQVTPYGDLDKFEVAKVETDYVIASRNGNRRQPYWKTEVQKWRVKKPKTY